VERAEQPYAGIRGKVTMQTVSTIADRIPEIFGWLGAHGIEPVGAPFLKYNVIDMERELDIEAGVPVAAVGDDADDVRFGVLPAGRFATVIHVGPFDGLVDATARLLERADAQGLRWDAWDSPEGHAWRCRLEIYETNPAEEPDQSKWETELAFRLAD
jgi:effector-binding domain-containing protein